MRPKPELYNSHYAEWFKDPDVIAAYPSRPPYARSAMGEIAARAFDTELRQVLTDLCSSGEIRCASDSCSSVSRPRLPGAAREERSS